MLRVLKQAVFVAPAAMLLLTLIALVGPSGAGAAVVPLTNAGFESDFTGWSESDPAAVSDLSRSGSHSAKVEGSGARVSQTVSVTPNTSYTLSAWVAGNGTVGATVSGSNSTASGGGDGDDDFEQVSVSFNSGSTSSITIYGAYNGETARFDDFTLNSGTSSPPPTAPPPSGCGFDWSWWALEGANPVRGNGSMMFDALEEFVITPNGNGPRHEVKIDIPLRESMTDVYEDFEADVRVDLDDGGKTIIAQHHAGDLGTIVKLYIADSSEGNGLIDGDPDDGEFDVYVRMAPAGGGSEIVYPIGVIESGDSFWFRILNDHGDVTAWFDGPGFNSGPIGTEVEDSEGSYLKFGNYLQAQTPDLENIEGSENWADYFDDAGIDTALITMSNVCHERQVD